MLGIIGRTLKILGESTGMSHTDAIVNESRRLQAELRQVGGLLGTYTEELQTEIQHMASERRNK
jgi:hypothetical protein